MNLPNLPALRAHTLPTAGLNILVAQGALRVMQEPATAPLAQRAIDRAVGFASGPEFSAPRTVMIEGCPLTVHVDPSRGAVFILSKFPGWPAVTEQYIVEILPYCSPLNFA